MMIHHRGTYLANASNQSWQNPRNKLDHLGRRGPTNPKLSTGHNPKTADPSLSQQRQTTKLTLGQISTNGLPRLQPRQTDHRHMEKLKQWLNQAAPQTWHQPSFVSLPQRSSPID
ncbi:hypothetical protein GmHk_U060171 [Glycine max]|nr:hypothetical protein GmHk_U060171 [Glycine max]